MTTNGTRNFTRNLTRNLTRIFTLALTLLAGMTLTPHSNLNAAIIITAVSPNETIFTLLSGDGFNNYNYQKNIHTGPGEIDGQGFAEDVPGIQKDWTVGVTDYLPFFGNFLFGSVQFVADNPAPVDVRVFVNGHFLQPDPNNPNNYPILTGFLNQGLNQITGFFVGPHYGEIRADALASNIIPCDPPTDTPNPTPEPGTWVMLAAGIGMLALGRYKLAAGATKAARV